MPIEIDSARIVAELDKLAHFSDTEPPAVTRIVYSEADQRARGWLKELCVAAGLTIREDSLGNLFARWQGSDNAAGSMQFARALVSLGHSTQSSSQRTITAPS